MEWSTGIPIQRFSFAPAPGPVFDMGPYYPTALVSLLGPVAFVQASGQIGFAERLVTTPGSTLLGQRIKVETLTTVQALLEFQSGAQVTFLASWDVWRHGVQPIELHGEKASLGVPDPNWFGGDVQIARERADWISIATGDRVFGKPNWPSDKLHTRTIGAWVWRTWRGASSIAVLIGRTGASPSMCLGSWRAS